MKIEVKEYTYETMPDYTDHVDGAKEIVMTGEEIGLDYIPDVIYDHKDGVDLHLQIVQPKIFNHPEKDFPCVMFVQGSAWMKQNIYRNVANISKLASKGYVVAIVEYRHSGIAHFPAQIIDAKNAIRFMKANHELYHVDKENVIIMGDSSGGHTSAMAGMTANTNLFDEPVNEENCQVKGIIDLYGAVDVTLPYGFPGTLNHQLPDSPEGMLMGYNIRENLEKAKAANAKTYAANDYAPMLIMHGTKDKMVFCQESVDLYEACKAEGKDVTFYFVRNSDHGGAAFWTEETVDIYHTFIQRCLNITAK